MDALLEGGPACVVARHKVVALFGGAPARTVSAADIDLAIEAIKTENLPVGDDRWVEIRDDLVQFADKCRTVRHPAAFWPEPTVWRRVSFDKAEGFRFARHICYRKVVGLLENGQAIAALSMDDIVSACDWVWDAFARCEPEFNRLEFHQLNREHFIDMAEFILKAVHQAQLGGDTRMTTLPVAMPD